MIQTVFWIHPHQKLSTTITMIHLSLRMETVTTCIHLNHQNWIKPMSIHREMSQFHPQEHIPDSGMHQHHTSIHSIQHISWRRLSSSIPWIRSLVIIIHHWMFTRFTLELVLIFQGYQDIGTFPVHRSTVIPVHGSSLFQQEWNTDFRLTITSRGIHQENLDPFTVMSTIIIPTRMQTIMDTFLESLADHGKTIQCIVMYQGLNSTVDLSNILDSTPTLIPVVR